MSSGDYIFNFGDHQRVTEYVQEVAEDLHSPLDELTVSNLESIALYALNPELRGARLDAISFLGLHGLGMKTIREINNDDHDLVVRSFAKDWLTKTESRRIDLVYDKNHYTNPFGCTHSKLTNPSIVEAVIVGIENNSFNKEQYRAYLSSDQLANLGFESLTTSFRRFFGYGANSATSYYPPIYTDCFFLPHTEEVVSSPILVFPNSRWPQLTGCAIRISRALSNDSGLGLGRKISFTLLPPSIN